MGTRRRRSEAANGRRGETEAGRPHTVLDFLRLRHQPHPVTTSPLHPFAPSILRVPASPSLSNQQYRKATHRERNQPEQIQIEPRSP